MYHFTEMNTLFIIQLDRKAIKHALVKTEMCVNNIKICSQLPVVFNKSEMKK